MICTNVDVKETIPTGFTLYVNGKIGQVHVNKGDPVTIRLEGGDPVDDVIIGSPFGDTLAQGTSDENGVFEVTLSFDTDGSYKLRGFEDCIAGICAKETNVVELIVGGGSNTDQIIMIVGTAVGLTALAYLLGRD